MKPHPERENESREEAAPPGRSVAAALVAVVAVYAYFLIFAQFGFLHALSAALGGGPEQLRPVLGVMGLAGIAGSGLMAWVFTVARGRALMTAGFVVAGAAAALTAGARTPGWFLVAAALTGAGTGVVTVGLAAMLRRETGGARLGWVVGSGTGLAYAMGNLPPVFAAEPSVQAALGMAAAGVGWVAVACFRQRGAAAGEPGPDYARRGIVGWTLIFFTLVAVDSAVFAHIQHTAGLKAATWTGGRQLLGNAAAHLGAGWLAGWMLERRRLAGAGWLAGGLMGAGMGLIFTGRGAVGAPCYAAGVTVYSALLVFYPAWSGRPGLAAGVYAVAGWVGSALGLGLAAHLGGGAGWGPGLGLLVVPVLLGLRRRGVQ